jgi:hypothetical protein
MFYSVLAATDDRRKPLAHTETHTTLSLYYTHRKSLGGRIKMMCGTGAIETNKKIHVMEARKRCHEKISFDWEFLFPYKKILSTWMSKKF